MKTVLIADDETDLLDLYDAEFRRAGYGVRTATTAAAALQILEAEKVDCVVMDIRMPGEDGLEAISRIRHNNRDLPIVLNSAYGSYKNDFHSWLADAYVVKSPDISELVETVTTLMEGRSAP